MNNTFYAPNDYRNYLEHHGIRGMKWGVRRFQNKDGSYTSAGKSRYGVGSKEAISAYRSSYDKASSMGDKADEKWRETQAARKEIGRTAIGRTIASARNNTEAAKKYNKLYDEWSNMQDAADEQWRDSDAKYKMTGRNRLERVVNNIKYDMKPLTPEQKAARNAKIKKVALAVAGTAAVAAGTYAAHKYLKGTMKEADSLLAKAGHSHKNEYFSHIMDMTIKAEHATAAGDHDTARFWTEAAARDSRNRELFDKTVDQAVRRGSTRRKAQRAVIERDYRTAKNKVMDRIYQAKGHDPEYSTLAWKERRNQARLEGQVDKILYNARVSKKNRRK